MRATAASAIERLSSQEIAALPQDKVAIIQKTCAMTAFGFGYEERVDCEDKQYAALKKLIDRGSFKQEQHLIDGLRSSARRAVTPN